MNPGRVLTVSTFELRRYFKENGPREVLSFFSGNLPTGFLCAVFLDGYRMVPGFAVLFPLWSVAYSMNAFTTEREAGVFLTVLCTPVTAFELTVGKIIGYTLIALTPMTGGMAGLLLGMSSAPLLVGGAPAVPLGMSLPDLVLLSFATLVLETFAVIAFTVSAAYFARTAAQANFFAFLTGTSVMFVSTGALALLRDMGWAAALCAATVFLWAIVLALGRSHFRADRVILGVGRRKK